MKYIKLFESFDTNEIHEICKKYGIKNYKINTDGSIDVDGVVNLTTRMKLTKLPLKFNKINNHLWCDHMRLTSLEGSPVEVDGDFYCNWNKLTSFKYAPKIIRGNFNCNFNNIKSFEYFPRYVGGDFYCFDNPILHVWRLFQDAEKIELLNDFDIFRDEDTDKPVIIRDRLNDFLLTIGRETVKHVNQYKNK